ncbi:DUF6236 family protein [Phenylobacterium sp. LjRoot164]|uniref:DUF6236 family protein n=1 Tax=unclassified Phenylobacterium TaxID=2640670 RepID=UPI003ECD5DCD
MAETRGFQAIGWDPTAIRKFALLWDRLDWPDNNSVNLGTCPELDFLGEEGIFQRSRVNVVGGTNGGAALFKAVVGVTFDHMEATTPGQWAVAEGIHGIDFPEDRLEEGRGILFRLSNSLPFPSGSVSMHDVLDFKRRRGAELLALRAELDGVYQRIIVSGDPLHAEMAEIGRLDQAIADHIKVTRESGLKVKFSDLQVKLNAATYAVGMGAAVGLGHLGMGAATAALGGIGAAVAASIELTVGLRYQRVPASPFAYISSFTNEVALF